MNRSPRPESPQHAGPALAAPRDASVRAERAAHLGPADVLEETARLGGAPLVEVALALRECGINPIHLKQDKTPWERHDLFNRAWRDDASLRRKFGSRETRGIGMACGAVSGNLEVMDFESVDSFESWCALANEYGLGDVVARVRAGYCVRTYRGYHLAYRVDGGRADKPLKLALGPDRRVLIETRGQGSYVVAPPSPLWDSSSSRAPGGEYAFESGSFATITTITTDERRELHNLARTLTHATDPAVDRGEHMPREPRGIYDDERPSDRFDQRADWHAILGPHGWKRLGTDGQGRTYWRRPGKDRGVSATTGGRQGGGQALFVFTTSTSFEAGRGYSPFWAYCHLEHGDDPSAAGQALAAAERALAPDVTVGVDLSRFEPLQRDVAPSDVKPEKDGLAQNSSAFPPHLLDVPGPMGALVAHIVETAAYPQPVLALAASIGAVGTVAARAVMTDEGIRSNEYTIGVARSGAGKEHARKVIRAVFKKANRADVVAHDSFASDAAIWRVARDGERLFLIDEFGLTLARITKRGAASHESQQVDALLCLYSDDEARTKTYVDASRDCDPIEFPAVCIYATSTPSTLYEALSGDLVRNGYLARFLIFESKDVPPPRRARLAPPPESVVALFTEWTQRSRLLLPNRPGAELAAKLLGTEYVTRPAIVDTTPEAVRILDALRERASRKRLEARDEIAELYSRLYVHGVKLALIYACGQSTDPTIDAAAARWGAELADHLTAELVRTVARCVGSNERERISLEVQRWIEDRGTVSTAEYTRKFRRLDRRTREDIVRDLVDSGLVTITESGNTGGRPRRDILWKKA